VNRPHVIANFVQTVDGKIQGPGAGYWPVGSKADLESLLDLRAECDVLVHGRQTAMNHEHIKRLGSPEFQSRLVKQGRDKPYVYVVLSAHPDALLLEHLDPGEADLRVVLVTTGLAEVPQAPKGVEVWRCGDGEEVDLAGLMERMGQEDWHTATLEAGPRLFGAFVEEKLVNELWLTIAPKLFGTAFGTPTMINGVLFGPDEVPLLVLQSVKQRGDEIFARYRFKEVRS
jgi:riboflavin biosynthesis pyrimidine reductase